MSRPQPGPRASHKSDQAREQAILFRPDDDRAVRLEPLGRVRGVRLTLTDPELLRIETREPQQLDALRAAIRSSSPVVEGPGEDRVEPAIRDPRRPERANAVETELMRI